MSQSEITARFLTRVKEILQAQYVEESERAQRQISRFESGTCHKCGKPKRSRVIKEIVPISELAACQNPYCKNPKCRGNECHMGGFQ